MSYAKRYKEEVKIFNDISRKFDNLVEEDIIGAFELQKESIQAYNRWSHIKYEIKKELKEEKRLRLKKDLRKCVYILNIYIQLVNQYG